MTDTRESTLQGKAIVVLGGTTGIGLSAAKAFVAAGARVLVVGVKPDEGEGRKDELGNSVITMFADAREARTSEEAIAKAVDVFGKLDGLYHVAGGSGRRFGDGPLHEVTDEGWQATLELNLSSLFYSNRAAVRQFLKQKTGGSILNLSSVVAFSPSPHYFATHAYAGAKAAIIGLTRSCAGFYAPQGIRFNVIAPGLIATPMSERAQSSPEIQQFIRSKQPLDSGRIGQPNDLDAAAVFFMSGASKFVTGQVLAVDGGWSVTEGQIPSSSGGSSSACLPVEDSVASG
jgi:NAD(P)-dependent dehydrogenase (short-subunit alcohol dehydrogenase family)